MIRHNVTNSGCLRPASTIALACFCVVGVASPVAHADVIDAGAITITTPNGMAAKARAYDVIVAGAGLGGIAAALQAARMGAHVALLEETDWVGGQIAAAGVGTIDGGLWLAGSGIYREFRENVTRYYASLGKSYSTCYYSTTTVCVEPHVARALLLAMVAHEPKIELRLRQRVTLVRQTEGPTSLGGRPTITGVAYHDDLHGSSGLLAAPIVIDATEYGDLLQKVAQPYRLGITMSAGLVGANGQIIRDDTGTKTTDAEGKAFALGTDYVQSITYVAIVRKYPSGVPPELVLHSPPPHYTDNLADYAQVVTADGHASQTQPMNWTYYAAYRALPDSANPTSYDASTPGKITRTAINLGNDYPVNGWLFNEQARSQTICAAKLKTIGFLYYMQHVLGLTDWSVANDEGYHDAYNVADNQCPSVPGAFKSVEMNMPVIPYVRESLRMVGMETEHLSEVVREGCWPATAATYRFHDSVALGEYPVDQHGFGGAELSLDTLRDLDVLRQSGNHSGPFDIPFGSLVALHVDGLIATEKNISQSRFANGASREQPSVMSNGQAAGVIAAIAALNHKPPRMVSTAHVQQILRQAGAYVGIGDAPRFPPELPCPTP